jgi:hypothetical protein
MDLRWLGGPDDGTREHLLRELEAGWLFTDVSGFASSMDDDDERENEGDTPHDV